MSSGWFFRVSKTTKLFGGLLRLTASRSGLSASVGNSRARIGVNSRGQVRKSVKVANGWRLRKG